MGVTHDQQTQLFRVAIKPVYHVPLQFYPFPEILCWTRGIPDPYDLKTLPDTSDNKPPHPPPSIIQPISLMTMGEEYLFIRRRMTQDQTFTDFDFREKRFRKRLPAQFSFPLSAVMEKIPFHISGVLPFSIVVSPYHIEPLSLVKLAHLPENMAVGLPDGFKGPVFPEFIPISDFNIGEALIVVEI
jgi:hypothetical protein